MGLKYFMKKLIFLLLFIPSSALASITFDVTNDVINCGSDASLDDLNTQGNGGLTLSAWIQPTSLGEGSLGCIIRKGDLLSNSGQYTFQITTNNVIRFQKDCATGDMTTPSANNSITLDVWQHVLVTWDGSATAANAHIYVNGAEVSYGIPVDGVGAVRSDASLTFNIGNGTSGTITFGGLITEVAAFNKILSANEIAQLYGGGSVPKKLPASIDRSSLKGYWPMNENTSGTVPSTGNVIKDWSNNKNDGKQAGSPVYSAEPNNLPNRSQVFSSTLYSGSAY